MGLDEHLDPYERKLEELAQLIKHKGRLRDETAYKGAAWHRLQDEIDRLAHEMLDYEEKIPSLRAQAQRQNWKDRLVGVISALVALSVVGAVVATWLSPWWLLLAALTAFFAWGAFTSTSS